MTQTASVIPPAAGEDPSRISIFDFAIVLLRWWRVIVGLGVAGGLLGLTLGLTSARTYKAEATFIPQGTDLSSIASLSATLGLRAPSAGNVWGPPVYVELLRSDALLAPIAVDTFLVAEERRRAPLMDLLKIQAPDAKQRVEYTVRKLRLLVNVTEDRKLSAVRVSVATEWPSVSFALVNRLVEAVNEFNLQTRKSQATAERKFADEQAAQAELELRNAEDRLQAFLQGNRNVGGLGGSPQLTFSKDRLQREVSLREQVYRTLLQAREDARIREVRDTPVITILEAPRLPVLGEPRNSVRKAILTGLAWTVIGVLIAFFSDGLRGLATRQSGPSREFFRLLGFGRPRLANNRE